MERGRLYSAALQQHLACEQLGSTGITCSTFYPYLLLYLASYWAPGKSSYISHEVKILTFNRR